LNRTKKHAAGRERPDDDHAGSTMKLSIKLIECDREYIVSCPELDINCYAPTKNEALRRIVTVISFYIDSAKELGLEVGGIEAINVEGLPACTSVPLSPCAQPSKSIN